MTNRYANIKAIKDRKDVLSWRKNGGVNLDDALATASRIEDRDELVAFMTVLTCGLWSLESAHLWSWEMPSTRECYEALPVVEVQLTAGLIPVTDHFAKFFEDAGEWVEAQAPYTIFTRPFFGWAEA